MNIQGRNPIDTDKRKAALAVLNKQPTMVLQRLAILSKSTTAVHKLVDSSEFSMIKAYLGIQ